MYVVLVRAILLAALMDLGMSLAKIEKCHSRACINEVERAARRVLAIEWKPISVFPDTAEGFNKQ